LAGFFEELKRRKVIRVLVAYVVASWLLLQVADLLSSVLELPDWAPKLVFFLLAIGLVPALVIGATLFWLSGADERWIQNEGIPEVERQIAAGDLQAAFAAAMKVEEREPGSDLLEGYWREFSWKANFPSSPEGAAVYRRDYDDPESEWQFLGVTPLYDVRVPRGMSVYRFELEGHEPVIRLSGGLANSADRLPENGGEVHNHYNAHVVDVTFDPVGAIDANEIRVPGMQVELDGNNVTMADFFINR